MLSRRKMLARSLALGSVPWLLPRSASAQVADDYYTPAARQAVQDGLAWLAEQQHDGGGFGSAGYVGNAAVSSLCGLAMLAAGNPPLRGTYGEQVAAALDFILENTSDSGFVAVRGATSHGPMYSHGFSSLFLAECYGMSMRSDVRDKLKRAINLIVQTQNRDGGWRYQPERRDADISVTICQIMALRAARNAGIYVPPETIDRCIDYVKRSQNADGGFMYLIHGGPSAFPRSAAGVVALFSSGVYDSPEIKRGVEYLMRFLPSGTIDRDGHYFYGHYYAVQAMWHAGGNYWAEWYPAIRDELLAMQNRDGSWSDQICSEYGTAMACIILQMPHNYLPIFQR